MFKTEIVSLAAALSVSLLLQVKSCTGEQLRPEQAKAEISAFQPLGRMDQYSLVFSDDFNGDTLNQDKWTKCYWWDDDGCTNLSSNEQQWYRPENITLEDGKLVLTARQEEVIGHEGRRFPYTSGMITTGRYYDEDPSDIRFQATEGFFEMRAKLPSGQGLWPAFWMLPITHKSSPEIDIMEMLGKRPDHLELHFHYTDEDGNDTNVGRRVRTGDVTQDFHIFGVDWTSERIVWYLDGKELWRYTERHHLPTVPMYMIINLAVGGDWGGNPDRSTVFPARMEIDYVRAWSRDPN